MVTPLCMIQTDGAPPSIPGTSSGAPVTFATRPKAADRGSDERRPMTEAELAVAEGIFSRSFLSLLRKVTAEFVREEDSVHA